MARHRKKGVSKTKAGKKKKAPVAQNKQIAARADLKKAREGRSAGAGGAVGQHAGAGASLNPDDLCLVEVMPPTLFDGSGTPISTSEMTLEQQVALSYLVSRKESAPLTAAEKARADQCNAHQRSRIRSLQVMREEHADNAWFCAVVDELVWFYAVTLKIYTFPIPDKQYWIEQGRSGAEYMTEAKHWVGVYHELTRYAFLLHQWSQDPSLKEADSVLLTRLLRTAVVEAIEVLPTFEKLLKAKDQRFIAPSQEEAVYAQLFLAHERLEALMSDYHERKYLSRANALPVEYFLSNGIISAFLNAISKPSFEQLAHLAFQLLIERYGSDQDYHGDVLPLRQFARQAQVLTVDAMSRNLFAQSGVCPDRDYLWHEYVTQMTREIAQLDVPAETLVGVSESDVQRNLHTRLSALTHDIALSYPEVAVTELAHAYVESDEGKSWRHPQRLALLLGLISDLQQASPISARYLTSACQQLMAGDEIANAIAYIKGMRAKFEGREADVVSKCEAANLLLSLPTPSYNLLVLFEPKLAEPDVLLKLAEHRGRGSYPEINALFHNARAGAYAAKEDYHLLQACDHALAAIERFKPVMPEAPFTRMVLQSYQAFNRRRHEELAVRPEIERLLLEEQAIAKEQAEAVAALRRKLRGGLALHTAVEPDEASESDEEKSDSADDSHSSLETEILLKLYGQEAVEAGPTLAKPALLEAHDEWYFDIAEGRRTLLDVKTTDADLSDVWLKVLGDVESLLVLFKGLINRSGIRSNIGFMRNHLEAVVKCYKTIEDKIMGTGRSEIIGCFYHAWANVYREYSQAVGTQFRGRAYKDVVYIEQEEAAFNILPLMVKIEQYGLGGRQASFIAIAKTAQALQMQLQSFLDCMLRVQAEGFAHRARGGCKPKEGGAYRPPGGTHVLSPETRLFRAVNERLCRFQERMAQTREELDALAEMKPPLPKTKRASAEGTPPSVATVVAPRASEASSNTRVSSPAEATDIAVPA